MRAVLAMLAVLALVAVPAAAAKSTVTIGGLALARLHAIPLQTTIVRKETTRSCQAGASKARVKAANETQRRASTVACEQPPRSNVLPSLSSTQAAAVTAAG